MMDMHQLMNKIKGNGRNTDVSRITQRNSVFKTCLRIFFKELLQDLILGTVHHKRQIMNLHLRILETVIMYLQFVHLLRWKRLVHILHHPVITTFKIDVDVSWLTKRRKIEFLVFTTILTILYIIIKSSITLTLHNIGTKATLLQDSLQFNTSLIHQQITFPNLHCHSQPMHFQL